MSTLRIDEYAFRITTVDIHGDVNAIKKHFDYCALTPVHPEMFESCLSADGLTTSYGSDLEHYIGCGPYIFDTWDYNDLQTYVKVEDHWLADCFPYENIEVRIAPTMSERIELFEQGEIYSLTPDAWVIEQYIDDPRMTTYGSLSVPSALTSAIVLCTLCTRSSMRPA